MTYKLLIGQRAYSSWSLRGWLPFDAFDIPFDLQKAVIYGDDFYDDVFAFAGGSTVPAVVTPDGGQLTDSLAIAWHLAEAFPNRGLLPADPKTRANALSLISTMHSGFMALRAACPMNLWTAWDGFEPDEAVQADLAKELKALPERKRRTFLRYLRKQEEGKKFCFRIEDKQAAVLGRENVLMDGLIESKNQCSNML